MVNKKDLLSQKPIELGVKDAVHVCIASVRANAHLKAGQQCDINEYGEAIPAKGRGVGVVNPFGGDVARGEPFWLMLGGKEVPNVRHTWDHPKFNFSPPSRPAEQNTWIARYAEELGVTYQQLMDACAYVVLNERSAPYPGEKFVEDFEHQEDSIYDIESDLWYEWSNETGHEFYNYGTECCPEYSTPDCRIFNIPYRGDNDERH